MDKYFRVEVISQTSNPQQVIYRALHQDYSEKFVFDESIPDESKCGQIAVDRCIKFNHWGVTEHPQIVLNCGWFPHSTMQQIRTQRILSFDVQSFRYTGNNLYELGLRIQEGLKHAQNMQDLLEIEKPSLAQDVDAVFYQRPPGSYTNRTGKKYEHTVQNFHEDRAYQANALLHYVYKIDQGYSEEHARGLIPFDVRQHWVMSANARSLMHLLDARWKADAQLECQWLCELIFPHFANWMPEIATWYLENRAKKARLAP